MAKNSIDIRGTDVLLIGGGLLAFFTIKKLLVKFGIADGPGTKSVINEVENPYSPWKPAFYQSKQAQNARALLIKNAIAIEYAKKIHRAFTVFQDDYNAILGVFSNLKTKSQVSYLSDIFYKKYGEDLLSFLTDGGGILPWDGLSDKHLKEITTLVDNLPKYQK